jgi:formate hydrogenlyase transcriptional activator
MMQVFEKAVESGHGFSVHQRYGILSAVSKAIITNRDLPALFHDLAGRLHPVIPLDHLALVLHDAATNTMRMHLLESRVPLSPRPAIVLPPKVDPAGLVCQSQRPHIMSSFAEFGRWPWLLEQVRPLGVQSGCQLPLTTARRRLGVLLLGSNERSSFDASDVGFMQQVADQVSGAVENSLANQELAALKGAVGQEMAELDDDVRAGNFTHMVAVSAALRRVLKQAEIVASTDATVLVLGETGTGKGLVARALHDLNPRRERAFVKVNCSAIPANLLESELFGHEKGSFTGAINQRIGRFEQAHGGTLFLDEVGDIPLELQPKLLRVLQEQEFERLGGTKTIKVDVRLVAATNRDLAQMVAEGRFRSDLYYRVNVFPLMLPPLRERKDAIPSLVRYFTQQFSRRIGRQIETIPTAVMEALVRYPWPGNVRELQNVIERAVILSCGPVLQVPLSELQALAAQTPTPTAGSSTLADADREHIRRVLYETGWVVSGRKGAAARLGVPRSTLQRKMKKLCIERD